MAGGATDVDRIVAAVSAVKPGTYLEVEIPDR